MKRFDIFNVLERINSGDTQFIERFSGEDLKGFQPYVVMLWLRGAIDNNEYHVYLTNELCNEYVFSLGNHPKLLYKLFCAANGFGDGTRYKFIKPKQRKSQSKEIDLLCEYYNFSPKQAEDALPLLTEDDIIDIANELGYEK